MKSITKLIISMLGLTIGAAALIKLFQIEEKEREIMGQIQDLSAAVEAAVAAEAAMEERVDGLIAALKAPHDSPEVARAIADLEALKGRTGRYQDERVPPADETNSAAGDIEEMETSNSGQGLEVDTQPLPVISPAEASGIMAVEDSVLEPDSPAPESPASSEGN